MRASLASLTVLLGVGCSPSEQPPVAMGTLEWDRVELIAEAAEPIRAIHVREGQRVSQGEVLIELDKTRHQLAVEQAQAVRDQADARLAELKRGPRAELIDQGRARVSAARAVLTNASEQLARTRELVERQVAGQADLDRRISLRDSAQEDLNAAEADLHALVEGTTLEELQQAEAALRQAEISVSQRQVDLQRLSLVAHRDGVVDALPYEIGDQPPVGASLAVLMVGEFPLARVYVPESIRVQVRPGTQAQVAVDGLDQSLQGRVRMIRNDATFTPYFALTEHDRGRLSFLAEVEIEQDDAAELPAGVPVQVTFPQLRAQQSTIERR